MVELVALALGITSGAVTSMSGADPFRSGARKGVPTKEWDITSRVEENRGAKGVRRREEVEVVVPLGRGSQVCGRCSVVVKGGSIQPWGVSGEKVVEGGDTGGQTTGRRRRKKRKKRRRKKKRVGITRREG